MNPYVSLAQEAIRYFLKTGKVLKIPLDLLPELANRRAGVFVSLHKKDGSLRGCIGTFLPTRKNIAEEIIVNAVAAGFDDSRFPPVTQKELGLLQISVDLLSQPKLVRKKFELGDSLPRILDPKKFGLIVSDKGGRKGLLLPDIPGVKSKKEQIEICYRKAGISPREEVKLEIFTVERQSE